MLDILIGVIILVVLIFGALFNYAFYLAIKQHFSEKGE